MKKKILGISIFITLSYLFFHFEIPHIADNAGCYLHKEVYNQDFQGKVFQKYIDSQNHNYQILIISMRNGREHETLNLSASGYMDLFDLINVNDSISKKPNSIVYRVKFKSTGKDTLFKFYSSCKDSLKKH